MGPEARFERKCEDCEFTKKSLTYCADCARLLCPVCDSRLHVLPAHARHHRLPFKNALPPDSPFPLLLLADVRAIDPRADSLVKLLRERCDEGEVFVLASDILENFCAISGLTKGEAESALERLEKAGVVRVAPRLPLPKGQNCVSFHLPQLSVESLIWVLKSLCRDRMTPGETQVYSRLKEVFLTMISPKDWKHFASSLASSPKFLARVNALSPRLPLISINSSASQLLFSLSNTVFAPEDVIDIPTSHPHYISLISFFKAELRNSEEIPGGKYGAALLAKLKGGPLLSSLSLGRLCGLVRVALSEGALVHKKTCVVLGGTAQGDVRGEGKEAKLFELQRAVLDLCREAGEKGVALPQLPLQLEQRLGRPAFLSELGFVKLKDFLCTLEEYIVVEQDEKGKWWARVRPRGTRQKLEAVRRALEEILGQQSCQVELGRLEELLEKRTGARFNPKDFGVQDFEDLLLSRFEEQFQVQICRNPFGKERRAMVQLRSHSFSGGGSEYAGFHYQVISPPISNSTSDMYNQEAPEEEDSPSEPSFDSKSMRFFKDLLEDD